MSDAATLTAATAAVISAAGGLFLQWRNRERRDAAESERLRSLEDWREDIDPLVRTVDTAAQVLTARLAGHENAVRDLATEVRLLRAELHQSEIEAATAGARRPRARRAARKAIERIAEAKAAHA